MTRGLAFVSVSHEHICVFDLMFVVVRLYRYKKIGVENAWVNPKKTLLFMLSFFMCSEYLNISLPGAVDVISAKRGVANAA